MGFLRQLEVENFKSWRGKQVIGPFMRFNCIIGTNGSGKSNVMDALSFVMGERASSLRVKHVRDLIHGAHVGRPVSSTARVTMRYRHGDEDGGQEELDFCRCVSGDGTTYHVNGATVTPARYKEELERIGIVTKTRNCLVFQGAVESVAMMNPKERTRVFERISQSGELQDRYSRTKESMMEAKEQTQLHLNRKKAAIAAKKQLSHDKETAQKYQTLLDDLNRSSLQLVLFELYCNEREVETLGATLAERRQAVGDQRLNLDNWEQRCNNVRKEHERHDGELRLVDKEIRSVEQELSMRTSRYTKAQVNASHHLKKADEARQALQEALRQRSKKKQELKQRRKEAAELERAWRSCEEKLLRERGQARDIELEEEQLERYKRLRETSRRQGAALAQQADKLQWDLKSDQEKITIDRRRKEELEASIQATQCWLEDLSRRSEKLEESTQTLTLTLEEFRGQEESFGQKLQRGRQRSEELNEELGRVLAELRDAGVASQESRRQERRKEVLESLCRLYPDAVLGRLVELCSPVQKKYQLAITRVFGRYMNAIVVKTERTARDCIHFIKTERGEPETFLPIDYLEVSPVDQRLRNIKRAEMALDVVQCLPGPTASQLKKALQFVCGNAVVCETIGDARRVAFDGPHRVKTVSLDGTMFSPSGLISGGSSDLRSRAKRWEEKELEGLKKRKEQLTADLRKLMKMRREEPELKQLQLQAQGAQTRLECSNAELENLRKTKIPECQAETTRLEALLASLEADIQRQWENAEVKEAALNIARDRMNQLEDTVFADFCAEIGVENIRQYEQEHRKEEDELEQKRLEFDGQFSRLNAQVEYVQQQVEHQEKRQRSLEETIAKEDRATKQQGMEEQNLLEAVEESQNKLQELHSCQQAKKTQASVAKNQLDKITKNLREMSRELVKLQKLQASTEMSAEQKHVVRHNLLLDCKVQGVELPLTSGSLEDISDVQLDEESLGSDARGGGVGGSIEIYEREARLVVDFSELPAALLAAAEGEEEEAEAQLEKLREAKASVESVLRRTTTPDRRSLADANQVKDKLREAQEALDQSTAEARASATEFDGVKLQRCELFNKCFEHVAVTIDKIYKRLCRNDSAQAILSADNAAEPYLDGVGYSCVAPGKRFMPMDSLSGGEKTMASLALLFALHSFRPAPFFVLDEVDASLDNTNIRKVTDFVREESRRDMQIIVISLKEEFYSRSDALLGIYSDYDECIVSRMLTVDLTPYPLDEEDDPEEEDVTEREQDQVALDVAS